MPEWFVGQYFGPGPWSTLSGGQPLRTKSGKPRIHHHYPDIQLPCCKACNWELNNRFERPLRGAVNAAFGLEPLTAQEAVKAGLWLLKTVLLLHHPDAESGVPGADREAWRKCSPDLFSWTIDGSPPPPDFSLWVHRHDETLGIPGQPMRFNLPNVEVGEVTYVCRSARTRLRDLGVTLVHHPAWELRLPAELEALSRRLWPPAGPVELASLTALAYWPSCFVENWRVELSDKAFDRAALPPLTPALDFALIPGARLVACPPVGRPRS